ncbi:MAG: signal peptidase I [Elusimicrobia bacterium]|nr:signal peptidase I [Elusimicrobiota bacterium]
MFVAMWKVFTKAGRPGWACLIPFYNLYVLLKIGGKPGWWILLLLIPLVQLVFGFLTMLGVAERFGKGIGYAVGLFLMPVIFYPLLAFGNTTYSPPAEE